MAMKPRLWSINGLATELTMDRRTVAKRLRHVPPDGRRNGHEAWYLETALPALRGERPAKGDGGAAAGGRGAFLPEALRAWGAPWTVPPARGDAFERSLRGAMGEMTCAVLLRALAQIPANVAWIAVRSGAPMRVAYAMWQHSAVTFGVGLLDQEVAAAGIEWRDPDNHYILPDEPDWAKLAELAGEPCDTEAWKRYANARFDGGAAA